MHTRKPINIITKIYIKGLITTPIPQCPNRGTDPIPPISGTKGYKRVLNRGCGERRDYYGDFSCTHEYSWDCGDCPIVIENEFNQYEFLMTLHGPPMPQEIRQELGNWKSTVATEYGYVVTLDDSNLFGELT